VGRFAPSPTGRLHLGSLTTALGSCLEARIHGGRWLLRIEDLDSPRIRPGAADEMLRTLEALGFEWDGPVVYQSSRGAAYAAALEQLRGQQRLYPCGCTRRQLAGQVQDPDTEGGYPGTCREGTHAPPPWSQRFRVRDERVQVLEDSLCGELRWPLRELGDPVVQRRDGLIAYQLAVVVDDATAGVTHVVRGADLLSSTAWQRELQEALALPSLRYLHLPLVTAADGAKLSKTATAVPLDASRAAAWLHLALSLLRQEPPAMLLQAAPGQIWQWAYAAWNVNALRGLRELPQGRAIQD
jgi:glutamyl-Q tRNA(Asp) synthetase